ncbi:MAG: hypothetical protein V7631_466 [Massilia sp.]
MQQLVARHAGHGVAGLGCTARLLRAFLDQPHVPLDKRCLDEIAIPPFQRDRVCRAQDAQRAVRDGHLNSQDQAPMPHDAAPGFIPSA